MGDSKEGGVRPLVTKKWQFHIMSLARKSSYTNSLTILYNDSAAVFVPEATVFQAG
jgi:hypothetical protein